MRSPFAAPRAADSLIADRQRTRPPPARPDPQETLGIPRQAPFALAANRPFGPAAAPATSRQASPPEQTIVDPRRAHPSAIRAIGDARRELVNAPDPDWELIIRIIKESYAG